jgi:hypothetical protein
VCLRAKRALERSEQAGGASAATSMPLQLPATAQSHAAAAQEGAGARLGELSSPDERRKFQRLGPIDLREVRACDLDELCQRLTGEN